MMYDNAPGSGDTQVVTAFFDTHQAAERARGDLVSAGFPADSIRFVPGAEAANVGQAQHEPGILESLLNIFVFMPSSDRMSYGEALRRGGAALAIRTSRDGYERAVDILDRDGAVDLDERETAWRAEGWTGSPAATTVSTDAETRTFEATHEQDKLVNPEADQDVRERIGIGTADQTMGTDIAPGNAVSEPARTAIPGEDESSITSRRDTEHGRKRVRSYVGSTGSVPTGIDPQI